MEKKNDSLKHKCRGLKFYICTHEEMYAKPKAYHQIAKICRIYESIFQPNSSSSRRQYLILYI